MSAETFPRVALVGERFNVGRAWRPKAPARETDLRFLKKLGAFREGPGRARLLGCGLRWDVSLNLLMPDAVGKWEAGRAREVAEAVRPALEAEAGLIVLAGRRVAEAFGRDGALPSFRAPYLLIPHPSGRCHLWNPGAPFVREVSTAFRLAVLACGGRR